MREYYSGAVLDFIYDADGRPYALNYNGTYYYYILNLQGDVIRLVNASGATVASYEYDPYGKVLSATGSMAAINPLRYRGYYYDEETGLYYLMSRYYDPQTGRFLNHDNVFDNDAGFPGFNLFVYCGNNPINRIDISGADSEKVEDLDLADDDVREYGGGGFGFSSGGYGGTSSLWDNFVRTMSSAAEGLKMASGDRSTYAPEKHHVLSNKNKQYTPQYQEIVERYEFSLSSNENIVRIDGHKGRHTNAYHEFMLYSVRELDVIAKGDPARFREGFDVMVNFLTDHAWILYAHTKN